MKTYNGSVVYRNDATDPSTSAVDLNAAITTTITVRVASTPVAGLGVKAVIFDIAEVGIANPMLTNNTGNYTFKVANGLYDIVIAEGLSNEHIIASEQIIEIQDIGNITEETVTLTDGQTTVVFASNNTSLSIMYLSGDNVDRGRLLEGVDYTNTNLTTIELASSYPAGTKIIASGSGEVPVGDVLSVFSRTGNVTAQNGDYNASQITTTPAGNLSSVEQQATNAEIDALITESTLNDAIYNKQTGTAYTLVPTDRGKTVSMNNAAVNVITIDTNANQAIIEKAVVILRQLGAGVTTLTAVAGVTLNGIDGGSVSFSAAYESASIDQQTINDWVYTGAGTVA